MAMDMEFILKHPGYYGSKTEGIDLVLKCQFSASYSRNWCAKDV